MPWNETNAMRERIRFIHEWEKGDLTMAGVCRKYGVSRPTGYKWIQFPVAQHCSGAAQSPQSWVAGGGRGPPACERGVAD